MMTGINKKILEISEKVYRGLVQLFPERYFQAFGEEMVLTFKDDYQETYRVEGLFGLVVLWVFTLWDLGLSISYEYKIQFSDDGENIMTNIRETINQSIILRFTFWVLGGMVGGLVVGLTLVGIYGWSLLSVSFWLGFGLLVGALSGGVSFVIYRATYGVIFYKESPYTK